MTHLIRHSNQKLVSAKKSTDCKNKLQNTFYLIRLKVQEKIIQTQTNVLKSLNYVEKICLSERQS